MDTSVQYGLLSVIDARNLFPLHLHTSNSDFSPQICFLVQDKRDRIFSVWTKHFLNCCFSNDTHFELRPSHSNGSDSLDAIHSLHPTLQNLWVLGHISPCARVKKRKRKRKKKKNNSWFIPSVTKPEMPTSKHTTGTPTLEPLKTSMTVCLMA